MKTKEEMDETVGHLEMALKHLEEGGGNRKHDPSWIRPMTMSRHDVNVACQQAYHRVHKALEILTK